MKNHFDHLDLFWSPALFRLLPAAALLLFLAAPAQAADRQQLHGHVPPAIARLHLQTNGSLPDAARLNLAIALPLTHQADLKNLLQQLYDPTSPGYRKFIKPDQFAARFGPSQADYDALKQFASDNALTVTKIYPNRILLDLNVSVADIKRVFHVNIVTYPHPLEHRAFFAPDAEPSIASAIPILHISGLDNYLVPRPEIATKTPIAQLQSINPALGSGPGGTYFAYDFRDAYVPGVTLDGTGQAVGLLELDGYYPTDIQTYEAQGGLPAVTLTNIPVDGFTGPPGPNNVEVALDIEMAISMAPGLSQIVVYEEPNGLFPITDILNAMATNVLANQLSSSWGIGDDPSFDTIYLEMAAQGQSFFQASGDNGSYNWADPDQDHADDPYITLVGGTTLSTTGPDGSWLSETVWNWNSTGEGDAASGGGISPNYAIPSYQLGINMSSNMGSTTFRDIPDVALTADNIYVVADDGQALDVGGTSAASPLWAAFCSLVNQKALSVGSPLLGFINPAIYTIGKGPLYGPTFHDIVTGNNTNSDDPTQFFAVPGYDLCTGWGTPAGGPLINALVPSTIAVPVLAPVSNTISGGNGNGKIDPDECNNLSILITNEGAVTATGVQGTLVSLTPGVLLGQPTASFPDVLPGDAVANETPFTVSTQPGFVCGTTVNLQLILKCDQTVQSNVIQLPSGVLGSPVAFSNPNSISIPSGSFTGASSSVTVSGIPSVGKVTASLYLTDLTDDGIIIQLISPNGTTVILAENDGALGANYGAYCTPASERTTFDDLAPQSIVTGVAPFVGTYSPVEPLSAFKLLSGTNANGTWHLNVINEISGNTATLQCWSLFIEPEDCAAGGGQCPGSDLSITMAASPITTVVGGNLVYSMTVSNAGPSSADNVAVVQNLPAGIQYLQSTSSQGSLSMSGSTLTFILGTIQALGMASITVDAYPTQAGLFTSTASVGYPGTDPNPDNNHASASVLVTKPAASLSVSMSAAPAYVPVDGQVTFTMAVTNNGPSVALGVTLTNFLPANANVVYSSSPTPGIASIGSLAVGAGAQVTLILSPTAVGTCTLTSTAGLDPTQIDPNPAGATATATVTVVPAAYLALSALVTPSPALSGANVTYLVTVTNGGPSPATSVVLSQTVPPGSTFKSTSSSTNASLNNGVISWNIGNMPDGASKIFTNIFTATNLLTGVASNVMVSTVSIFGQPENPNTNNSTLVLSTLVLRPVAIITPEGAKLVSQSLNPPNGAVNPGETLGVQFFLQNLGNIPTTNLVATLLPTGGVSSPSAPATYGALPAGGGVTNQTFYFTANATNGGTIVATLSLYDGPTNFLGTASFTFLMPVVSTFWNNQFISIPAQQFTNYPASGPANPYPSSNLVSGIASYVANVTVTVSNLYHSYPHDIELLLVGPGGQSSILMSGAAAETAANFPVTLTFDQTAANPIPGNSTNLMTGSFQPAAYNTPVFTNGPAPPPGGYIADLSVFSGLPANGWWQLWAYDVSDGDYGAISNGWGLTITTITPVNQIADLGVGVTASPNPVFVGSNVTFAVTVTNLGTNAVTAFFLTNLLSPGLVFVSTNVPSPVTQTNQTQFYNFTNLQAGSSFTLSVVAAATNAGSLASTATIGLGSSLTDLNPVSTTASASVTAILPTAALFPGISASTAAGPVLSESNVTIGVNIAYALLVTNNGPNEARNVVGVLTQSATGFSNNLFTNSFGNMDPGANAAAFFTNAPEVLGQFTNTWILATDSTNSDAASNSFPLVFNVIPPEPVIVLNGVRLLSESALPPNGAINSNETVVVAFILENIGAASSTNLTATLLPTNGVTPTINGVSNTETVTYGAISPGASASQNFQFIARGSPGSTITAVLTLQDSSFPQDSLLGTISNSFVIPTNATFSNPAFISIPDEGTATPYPSSILVSGAPGVVSKVTASLQDFTHSFPHDVNVLLTSPSGQQVLLMAHAGGPYSVTNLILGFDQAATQYLPVTQLVSSTNLPTQDGAFDSFPGIPGTPSITNLNTLNGSSPNGLWSLYILDDTAGNDGSVANGWTLGLTLVTPVNAPGTLALGMTSSPNPVIVSNFLTYTIAVTNLGNAPATNVLLTETLPPGAILVSAAASQGTVNTSVPGAVAFSLGTITNTGGTAFATNVVQPTLAGTILASAIATNQAAFTGATASNLVTVASLTDFSLSATSLTNRVRLTLTTFAGQTGQNFIIQVSTNLITWTNLSTNTALGVGQFSITNSFTNGPARFYRAEHLPQ
jgi:uncharacterized repeat protein (TIGR01451 family)